MENEWCIVCGSGNVTEIVKDKEFVCCGEKFIIENYRTVKCDECACEFADRETIERSDSEVERIRKLKQL